MEKMEKIEGKAVTSSYGTPIAGVTMRYAMRMAIFTSPKGEKFLNTTPHPIAFGQGEEEWSLPDSGIRLNAKEEAIPISNCLQRKSYIGVYETQQEINSLLEEFPGLRIIGSAIAMMAYNGVLGLEPCKGLERATPQLKRYRDDLFNVS